MSSEVSSTKRSLLTYSLNASLVLFALFLSYRIISPQYERKESTAVNKLGSFHTQLAAERLGARLGTLREEMKENGMRIVDPARGPVTLDSTRWLWLRIQDRDWRAPKYLEPLPSSRTDIDTWGVSFVENSFVISERIPILKEGILDYVLLEGGLRSNIFQDIQSDAAFGVWIFDLKAYEKGGLGAAKLYERSSSTGALTKDEVKLLTSDLLMDLFQKQNSVELNSKMPWVISFKNSSGPSSLGVLGYWVPEAKPVNMLYIWLTLGAVLLFLSAAISFYLIRSFKPTEEWEEAVPAQRTHRSATASSNLDVSSTDRLEVSTVSGLKSKTFEGLYEWVYSFARELKGPLQDLHDRIKSFKNSSALLADSSEIKRELPHLEAELVKTFSMLSRLESYFGKTLGNVEVFDVEIFFKEFQNLQGDLPAIDSFFDPDLWRVNASKEELGHLIRCYALYLIRRSTTEKKVNFSARYVTSDVDDSGCVELLSAKEFKAPFVRLSFYVKTNNPIGRKQMAELFDLEKTKERVDTEMALTLKIVMNMGGRLRIKSSFDDGNVILLDLPAFEARRAEDKVNVKQMPTVDRSELTQENFPASAGESVGGGSFHQNELESKTVLSLSGVGVVGDAEKTTDTPTPPTMRLAEIEKANSFAEDISDERSRVRSRFRVRKPGEKT